MKFEKHYLRSNHSVGIAFWHVQFCTKYRYAMFAKFKYKSLCEACIRKVAFRNNARVIAISVMPDHVHMIVQTKQSTNIVELVRKLKGASAYLFFRNHVKARLRYPRGHLWSRGYFTATVGFADFESTLNYVLHQEECHASSLIGNPHL